MRENRVIKLPVFRTMFQPIARKEWKCHLCKETVEVGKRYIHYIDRQPHKIISYRFHIGCFGIVMAYCAEKHRKNFTPITVRKWAEKTFCEPCKEECSLHPCDRITAKTKAVMRNKKSQKPLDNHV